MRYRHLKRTVIAVLATVALFLIVGLTVRWVLEAGPTRRAAIRWIEKTAERSGAELEIGDLHWGILPPSIRLRRVELDAAGVTAAIEAVEIELASIRLTTRTIELGTVAARGVRVALDGLPQPADGEGGKLKVRVRHLELDDIEFDGVDLPGGLALELDGVRGGWSSDDGFPKGFLEIAKAHVELGGMTPFDTALISRFEIPSGELIISKYRLDGDGFDLSGRGRLSPSIKRLEANGTVDVDWLDGFIKTNGLLGGSIRVAAVIDSSEREFARADVQADRIRASLFPVENVEGSLSFDGRQLRGRLDRARFHGGRISGDYVLEEFGGRYPHRVAFRGTGVSAPGFLGDINVDAAGLAATMDLDGQLRWNGKQFPVGQGEATIDFRPSQPGLPVEGPLTIRHTGERILRFDAEELHIGSSTARWQGALTLGTWEPAWAIDVRPAVLEEIAPLVNRWVQSTVLPENLSGAGELQVNLSGPFTDLVVNARVDAQPLSYDSIVLDRLIAEATIASSFLRLGSARYQIGDGFGEIEGGMAWDEAAGEEQLDLEIRGRLIPLASVASWVDLDRFVDEGLISFSGHLGGPIALPTGSWRFDVDEPSLSGLALGLTSTTIELSDAVFTARDLSSANGMNGEIHWDVGASVIGGSLAWPDMPLATFGDAFTTLIGETADTTLDFALPRDAAPTGRLEANAENGHFTVDVDPESVLVSAGMDGAAEARATLQRASDGSLSGPGSLDLSSARELLAYLAPDAGVPLDGSGRAAFDVEWSDSDLPRIDGVIEDLELSLDNQPVELLEQSSFTLSEHGFEVPGLRLRARDEELFVRWDITEDGTLSGNLSGTMDALLLRFLLPDWEPAGRATGIVEFLGSIEEPLFEGIAEIEKGSFRLPGTRTILSQVSGTVLLSSGEVQLEGMDFRIMGGRGRTTGRIRADSDSVILSLTGTATGIRYEVLPDLEARLSGSWRLIGPVDDLTLSGDIDVDRMNLNTKEDLASLLLRWFGQSGTAVQEGGINLALHIEAEESIDLRSPFLRLKGSASVDLSGTSNRPGLVGQVEALEGGEATLLGNRYEIERASLNFSNPDAIEPFLDLQASTFVQDYGVTVQLSGTTDRFVSTAVSTPPLSAPDIYSLLGVGYRGSNLGSSAMGLGLASSILSSELTSVLKRRGEMVLPVDQVRVDPFAADTTGNPTARLSVIKQLTPAWTVIVQTTLSGVREQLIVSRWYLAPGLFIEAAQHEDGSLSLDLKLRRPY